MLCPAERFAIENAQRFEKAVPIEKAAIEDRNHSLRFRDELVVEQHDHVADSDSISVGAANRSAWKKPLALANVSSYSAAGIESATIPAPA